MSLINCPECGREISAIAKVCPGCGRPRQHKRKWILRIILVAGSIAVLGPLIAISYFNTRNRIIGPEGWAMDNAVKQLREKMRDPESMKIVKSFTWSKRAKDADYDNIYVCGIVDGKNAFGAYAGGTRFASWSTYNGTTFDTVSVQLEDPSDIREAERVGMQSGFEKEYWNPWCDTAHKDLK